MAKTLKHMEELQLKMKLKSQILSYEVEEQKK